MKQRRKLWSPLVVLLLAVMLAAAQTRPAQALSNFFTPWTTQEQWNQQVTPQTGLTMFAENRTWSPDPSMGTQERTLYGLKDASGAVVVPAEYTKFCFVSKDRIIAQKWWLEDGQYEKFSVGMMDVTGKVVFPFRTETADIIPADWNTESDGGNHTFLVETSVKVGSGKEAFNSLNVGLYDWDLRELVSPYQYSVHYQGDGAYILSDNSAATSFVVPYRNVADTGTRYGLYRYGVGITIPAEYIELTPLGGDLYAARRPDFYCGVLDGSGNQVLPFVFADVTGYRDGYFTVGVFRSQADYQKVRETGFFFDSMGDDYWSSRGFDMSDAPSYVVYGIVDRDEAVIMGFDAQDEYTEFNDQGKAVISAWKGEHGPVWPFGNSGSFSTVVLNGKTYSEAEYDIAVLDLFQKMGTYKTVSDVLQEYGQGAAGGQTQPSATAGGFSDVAADAYYADPVVWAVDKGITSGTTATTFSPDATCTTAQILTFLWRASGSPAATVDNPFSDVDDGDYYASAALWAYEKGLVSGTSLNGGAPATRAATVTYLWKLAGEPEPQGSNPFTDVTGDSRPMVWAMEQGITAGTGQAAFGPGVICTRGQIMTFLYRDMGA